MKSSRILSLIVLLTLQSSAFAMIIHPQWGEKGITYYKRTGSSASIWAVDPKSQSTHRVTEESSYYHANPAWSPDGSKMAYASGRPDMRGQWDIVIRDLNTGKETFVTNGPEREMHPTWSPDGQWIAFTRMANGGSDIFMIKPDGSGLKQLTLTPGREFHPKWGSDSLHIVYDGAAEADAGRPDSDRRAIFLLDTQSGYKRTLVRGESGEMLGVPSFSPDMTTVAFGRMKNEIQTLDLVSVFTGKTQPIYQMEKGAMGGGPFYSPDGKQLAFHMQLKDGQYGLYTLTIGERDAKPLVKPITQKD